MATSARQLTDRVNPSTDGHFSPAADSTHEPGR